MQWASIHSFCDCKIRSSCDCTCLHTEQRCFFCLQNSLQNSFLSLHTQQRCFSRIRGASSLRFAVLQIASTKGLGTPATEVATEQQKILNSTPNSVFKKQCAPEHVSRCCIEHKQRMQTTSGMSKIIVCQSQWFFLLQESSPPNPKNILGWVFLGGGSRILGFHPTQNKPNPKHQPCSESFREWTALSCFNVVDISCVKRRLGDSQKRLRKVVHSQ